ncbi:hypothetical protein D3C83_267270 [compost metagenome]
MRPGQPARMSHDYKRHGTTTLFAAQMRLAEPSNPAADAPAGAMPITLETHATISASGNENVLLMSVSP